MSTLIARIYPSETLANVWYGSRPENHGSKAGPALCQMDPAINIQAFCKPCVSATSSKRTTCPARTSKTACLHALPASFDADLFRARRPKRPRCCRCLLVSKNDMRDSTWPKPVRRAAAASRLETPCRFSNGRQLRQEKRGPDLIWCKLRTAALKNPPSGCRALANTSPINLDEFERVLRRDKRYSPDCGHRNDQGTYGSAVCCWPLLRRLVFTQIGQT